MNSRRGRLRLLLIGLCLFGQGCGSEAEPSDSDLIRRTIEAMSTRQLIGQMLLVGPPWSSLEDDGTCSGEAQTASEDIDSLIEELWVGNFLIHSKSFDLWLEWAREQEAASDSAEDSVRVPESQCSVRMSAALVRRQISDLQHRVRGSIGVPALIATDLEGGRVQKLQDYTRTEKGYWKDSAPKFPSQMALAVTRDRKSARLVGEQIGEYLSRQGVNVNFAPVLDLVHEQDTSLIGTRAYSQDERLVAEMAENFSSGLLEAGVLPVLKHWPGHGFVRETDRRWSTIEDFHFYHKYLISKANSEHQLLKYTKPYEQMLGQRRFRGRTAVMTSHLLAPSCGCDRGTPVTFCPQAIDGKLRQALGSDTVVITDDLVYLCHTHQEDLTSNLVRAIEAGHDLIVLSSYALPESTKERQASAAKLIGVTQIPWKISLDELRVAIAAIEDSVSRERLEMSVARILQLKLELQQLRGEGGEEWSQDAFEPKGPLEPGEDREEKGDFYGDAVVLVRDRVTTQSALTRSVSRRGWVEMGEGIDPQAKILCVAPYFYSADCKKALRRAGFEDVEEYPLPYNPVTIRNQLASSAAQKSSDWGEAFIELERERIRHFVGSNRFNAIIYGLPNSPAHVRILESLRPFLDSIVTANGALLVVVPVHTPSILTSDAVNGREMIVASFSNQQPAITRVGQFLLGKERIRADGWLPVDWVDSKSFEIDPYTKRREWVHYGFVLFALALTALAIRKWFSAGDLFAAAAGAVSIVAFSDISDIHDFLSEALESAEAPGQVASLLELVLRFRYPEPFLGVFLMLILTPLVRWYSQYAERKAAASKVGGPKAEDSTSRNGRLPESASESPRDPSRSQEKTGQPAARGAQTHE